MSARRHAPHLLRGAGRGEVLREVPGAAGEGAGGAMGGRGAGGGGATTRHGKDLCGPFWKE